LERLQNLRLKGDKQSASHSGLFSSIGNASGGHEIRYDGHRKFFLVLTTLIVKHANKQLQCQLHICMAVVKELNASAFI